MKGEVFTLQGNVCREIGIVISGYFKYTTINSLGEESIINFAFENEFIVDFNRSFHGKPSEVSIVAGSNSTVYVLPLKLIKERLLASEKRELNNIYLALFNQCYSRLLTLYRLSPKERYLALMKKYPSIVEKVALRDIASFLLITPNHLSRLRREISSARDK